MNIITNHMNISNNIASSGQPTDSQFKLMAREGYKAVINLVMPNSENAIPEEGNIVTAHGMTYINIPVPWDKPTEHHLTQFYGVMSIYKDQKIWVHCVKNYRVSAFLFKPRFLS